MTRLVVRMRPSSWLVPTSAGTWYTSCHLPLVPPHLVVLAGLQGLHGGQRHVGGGGVVTVLVGLQVDTYGSVEPGKPGHQSSVSEGPG